MSTELENSGISVVMPVEMPVSNVETPVSPVETPVSPVSPVSPVVSTKKQRKQKEKTEKPETKGKTEKPTIQATKEPENKEILIKQLETVTELYENNTKRPKEFISNGLSSAITFLKEGNQKEFEKIKKEFLLDEFVPSYVSDAFLLPETVQKLNEEILKICTEENIQYENQKVKFWFSYSKMNDKKRYQVKKQVELFDNSVKLSLSNFQLGNKIKTKTVIQYEGEEPEIIFNKTYKGTTINNEKIEGIINKSFYLEHIKEIEQLKPETTEKQNKDGKTYLETIYYEQWNNSFNRKNLQKIDFKEILKNHPEYSKEEKKNIQEYFTKEGKLTKERNQLLKEIVNATIENNEDLIKTLSEKRETLENRLTDLKEVYKPYLDKIKGITTERKNENDLKTTLLNLHIELLKKRLQKYKGYISDIKKIQAWIKEYNCNVKIKLYYEKLQKMNGEKQINIEFSNEEIKNALINAFN